MDDAVTTPFDMNTIFNKGHVKFNAVRTDWKTFTEILVEAGFEVGIRQDVNN
jgi:hypothetical protein